MANVIPNVTNWSVTPINGQANYFSLMNTWLGESTTVISSLDAAIDSMNISVQEVNDNTITAVAAKDEAVAAKDEAVTALALLSAGSIDDTTIATNKAYSNQKTNELLDEKVDIDGNQTINDIKTFTSSPIVPTPTVGDNSTKVATTEFVNTNSGNVVLKTAYSELTTSGTTTATIPYDTSIPQQTEGAEILTCSITPTRADSNLLITIRTYLSETVNTGTQVVGALFRDATADAIATGLAVDSSTSINASEVFIQIRVPSTSTTATTFKLRVGNDIGSCRWNGRLATQYYGSTNLTSIHIQEEL